MHKGNPVTDVTSLPREREGDSKGRARAAPRRSIVIFTLLARGAAAAAAVYTLHDDDDASRYMLRRLFCGASVCAFPRARILCPSYM